MRYFTCLILLFTLLIGCKPKNGAEKKLDEEQASSTDDVSVININDGEVDTVRLVRDVVFESNQEVFIEGHISSFVVDNKNRVFIAALVPGKVGIYVFDKNGGFINRIANAGRGPGEYESISSMNIRDNELVVFDPRLQKVGVFSLKDFSHIRDISIDPVLLREQGQLPPNSKADKVTVHKDGQLLIRYKSVPNERLSQEPKQIYYRLSSTGAVQPKPILKLKSFSYYYPDGQFNIPMTMPFTRGSILAVSDEGKFFTTWTEEARINVFNSEGEYLKAIQIPLKDVPINMDEFELFPNEKRTLGKYELPKYWQKIHTIEFDNEGRLWIALITEKEDSFRWVILNKEKELIAEFEEPGYRKSYSVNSKPNRVIKGGFFYKHEFDMSKGIDRVVRYRVNFSRL